MCYNNVHHYLILLATPFAGVWYHTVSSFFQKKCSRAACVIKCLKVSLSMYCTLQYYNNDQNKTAIQSLSDWTMHNDSPATVKIQ